MSYQINIIDAMCGMGKTSAAINHINRAPEEKRFMYITPFLDEADRIIAACPSKKFVQPQPYGSKLRDIKRLIGKGRNIVSTHALFQMFDHEIMDLLRLHNYTLIMDEVANVVEPLQISSKDLSTILEKYTAITEDHLLQWTDPEYRGEFDHYRFLIEINAVYYYSGTALLWMFPVETFKAFDEVYILTYMFDAQIQRYYYDFNNVTYKYLYVTGDSLDTYEFTEDRVEYDLSKYKDLIHILDHQKLNSIGDDEFALSKSWYERNANNECMTVAKNALNNFFRNIVKTPSSDNLWTTFKDFKGSLSGKGYARGFLSLNARATNAYRHCTSLAYVANRYLNTIIKNFFVQHGVRVEEDAYALSELIQWMFRSQIRDGKPIDIYIPSRRMRELLQRWMEECAR